jgi:hypothetical protein
MDSIIARLSRLPYDCGFCRRKSVSGSVCYRKSDGNLWHAEANSTSTTPGFAIAAQHIVASGPGIFALSNASIINVAWTWTVEGLIYISAATPGLITQTEPLVGQQVSCIGIAHTATTIRFELGIVTVGMLKGTHELRDLQIMSLQSDSVQPVISLD